MKPNKSKSLFIQSSEQRILETLFKYPDLEFSLSDLARESRVAKPNMNRLLMELEQNNLLTIIRLAKIWRIRANTKSINFTRCKIMYNLGSVFQSQVIEFLNDHFKNPKVIILFGSFRKGEDISTSDIDIAIESDEVPEYQVLELKELSRFKKMFSRDIQVHLFNRKNVDAHVFNNITNGIVLSGFLEVKP